jgi:hypothetical protein
MVSLRTDTLERATVGAFTDSKGLAVIEHLQPRVYWIEASRIGSLYSRGRIAVNPESADTIEIFVPVRLIHCDGFQRDASWN